MTGLIILLCILLIFVIAVQIGKVSEIAGKIRGEEEIEIDGNKVNGSISMIFMILFLIGCVVSAIHYAPVMLGYGPHVSASVHGVELDRIFNVTLFFTGIVFILTQIALFYFAWKYQGRPGRKVLWMPHDNKLEVIWTIIPAIVMTFLVVGGLDAWNTVMADVGEEEDFIEIEATGMQFAWMLRYPGPDGLIGTKKHTLINANNPVGMDWTDTKNLDDMVSTGAGEIMKLPVGKKVRVRITSRDVLHNFDMPHFRIKMDAVPGLPTYFVFTPSLTTEEYRANLGALDKKGNPKYPEWWEPADEEEPDGPKRWEAFHFELACAELCGNGHYSMRRLFEIVSQEDYDSWAASQKSYYETTIKGTDDDPWEDEGDPILSARKNEFKGKLENALSSTAVADKTVRFDYVNFQTGSAVLTEDSDAELNNLAEAMESYPNLVVELAGHTDSRGSVASNQVLSQNRAQAVMNYLTTHGVSTDRLSAVGYGSTVPIASNETEEGRAENRRTVFKIIKQ